MINNAKNTKLNNYNSNLPNVSDVIVDWFLNISFDVVTRTMQGADYIESSSKTINTKGVVQPTSKEDLQILPEGEWSWEYLTMHCLPNVILNTNQYIIYDGVKYKIMGRKNFEKYGYIAYYLLESFKADSL